MTEKSFQDYYPNEFSHCYGCGRLNEQGLHIKSYWDGDEAVCTFYPQPYHMGIPGFVYGGLLAAVVDCHSTGTASAAAYRAEGREIGSAPQIRFVTGSLHLDYLNPTPIDKGPLELRARVKEIIRRKAIINTTISVNNTVCVRAEVVAVRIPESMKPPTV